METMQNSCHVSGTGIRRTGAWEVGGQAVQTQGSVELLPWRCQAHLPKFAGLPVLKSLQYLLLLCRVKGEDEHWRSLRASSDNDSVAVRLPSYRIPREFLIWKLMVILLLSFNWKGCTNYFADKSIVLWSTSLLVSHTFLSIWGTQIWMRSSVVMRSKYKYIILLVGKCLTATRIWSFLSSQHSRIYNIFLSKQRKFWLAGLLTNLMSSLDV